jgi:hypothetical protein
MKVYHKSPQTLGINPTCLQNLSVPIGEGQRVKSRVNSTVMTVNQNNNFSESNNNLFNQLENTSMRNTNSNQFSNNSGLNSMYSNNSTSVNTELLFSLINNKKFQKMIEELRIKEELSSDIETLNRNIKLKYMMEDTVYKFGEIQSDIISKNHKIVKTKKDYFNTCYRNSYRKMGEDIGYVEGFIINKSNPSGIIYHSWNINQDGEFIDYTFRNSSEYEYLGIVIPNEIVEKVITSIDKHENRKGYLHLPILPFLNYIEVEQEYSNRNHKRGGTVK